MTELTTRPTTRPVDAATVRDTHRDRDAIVRLLPWLRPEAKALIWTVFVDLLANVALVAQTSVLAWAVARAMQTGETPPGWLWPAAVGIVVLRMLLTWHEMDISHDVAYRVLAHLRSALFGGFARGVPRRQAGQHTGQLASTALSDVETLEFFYAHTVPQLVSAAVLLISGTTVLLLISPVMAVVLPISALLLAGFGYKTSARSRRLGAQALDAKDALATQVVDVVRATREVVAFGRERAMTDELVAAGRSADVAAAQSRLDSERQESVREGIVLLTVVAVLLLSLHAQVSGPLASAVTVGTLTVLAPIAAAATTVNRLQPLRAAAERVADTIDLPAEGLADVPALDDVRDGDTDAAMTRHLPAGPLGFSWRGVELQFIADDGAPGTHLRIPDGQIAPGEHVAVVGPSGCGKSSLLTVLSGLWVSDAGEVLVTSETAQLPLAQLATSERTGRIAVIDQDATLLRGTLRSNLTLGAPDASDELMLKSLATAGVRLEGERWADGLDTRIGEGGASLSGGQRARIALARALVQQPSVLILDETTSSLDARTEADVLARLADLPMTIIAVSHREATVSAMDRALPLGCKTQG